MSPLSEPHDVAATSLAYVLGLAAWALLSLGGVVIAASIMHDNPNVGAGFVTIAVLLGGLSMSAWGIYKTCYRVEVTDGYLVMRYLYRRRSVRLEEVQCIEYIAQDEDTPAKFDVLLRDGSHFRVVANQSTRALIEAIVRRQPDVLVIGQISPPTKLPPTGTKLRPTGTKPPPMTKLPPRTRDDNEFWSGRSRD
jgi:hypothetical protein